MEALKFGLESSRNIRDQMARVINLYQDWHAALDRKLGLDAPHIRERTLINLDDKVRKSQALPELIVKVRAAAGIPQVGPNVVDVVAALRKDAVTLDAICNTLQTGQDNVAELVSFISGERAVLKDQLAKSGATVASLREQLRQRTQERDGMAERVQAVDLKAPDATLGQSGLYQQISSLVKDGQLARDSGTGSPHNGASIAHYLHCVGWVQRDLRLALDAASPRKLGPSLADRQQIGVAETVRVGNIEMTNVRVSIGTNPCQGARCGTTDGISHSAECIIEAGASQGWRPTPAELTEAARRRPAHGGYAGEPCPRAGMPKNDFEF